MLLAGLLLSSQGLSAAPSQTLRNLSAFLTQVETKHPRLSINSAQLEAAKARTRAASQPLYNPEIDLDAERVSFNRNGRAETVTVGLSKTFDWHDKRSARRNAAMIAEKVVRSDKEYTRQLLIAEVFSALADYQAQREVIHTHAKRLNLAKQTLAQAQRLYKAGEISKLEMEQIRLSQTRAQLTLNQAKTALAGKAQALVTTSGYARKSWPVLPYAPPRLQADKLNYDQIVNNLPALKTQMIRIAQARSEMRLKVREKKADPTIGVRVGGDDSEEVLGLTLSIPLHVYNTFQAEVDEARANVKVAESTLENDKYRLKSQLRSAAQTYQLTYQSWQSWRKIASKSLKNQSQLLLRLWRAGELSTSDYLVQLNQIREAELNNVELKGNVWKAWFNWLATSNQFKQWLNGQGK
jgi:cobalt-zinc-cadmium efflux system outer membrane protein